MSRQSKLGSQLFGNESRDQRIFDVYMKAPYRLMDNARQRRQNNRQQLKNLKFLQSPSKEKLFMDGNIETAAMSLTKRYSIGSGNNGENLSLRK